MADKKKSTTQKPGGVLGVLGKIVRRPTPQPKDGKSKVSKPPTRTAKKAQPKKSARTRGATQAAKQSAPEPEKAKKKPPSITITRPEAMRPPPVELPVPKQEAPVGAPSILLPKGGQAITTLTPILRWMYVGGATRYEVEWTPDAHFGRGHSSTLTSAQTMLTLDSEHALKPGKTYQWRVRGGNDLGWGPWSAAESFRAPDLPR